MSGLETQIQASIVAYLRQVCPHCITFAIPNASRRKPGARASNGVPGLLPGMPDLGIIAPGGKVFLIEVKTDKTGLSKSQRELRLRFVGMDVPVAIARSIDDVRKALAHWDIESREVAA
jgi:hypothetical protein